MGKRFRINDTQEISLDELNQRYNHPDDAQFRDEAKVMEVGQIIYIPTGFDWAGAPTHDDKVECIE